MGLMVGEDTGGVVARGAGGRGFLMGVTMGSGVEGPTWTTRGEVGSGGGAGRGLDWLPKEALLVALVTGVGDPTEEAR